MGERTFQADRQRAQKHYGCRVYRSTAKAIVASTLTSVDFDTKRWDDGGFWVVGSPTLLTIPLAGLYLFGANVEWAANSSGNRFCDIYLNGTTIIGEPASGYAVNSGGGPFHAGECVWKCVAGDSVVLRLYQSSTITLNAGIGPSSATVANSLEFWVERLAA